MGQANGGTSPHPGKDFLVLPFGTRITFSVLTLGHFMKLAKSFGVQN